MCKGLGVVPNATIDSKRFYSLWAAYDVEKVGKLSPSTAKQFLREFAAAMGTPYSDTLADTLVARCDTNKTGQLDYECFKVLFVEAIKVDDKMKSRVHLTHSLVHLLPPLEIDWDNLPNELLSEIFSYLGHAHRKNVSMVSKRWRGLSMSIFTSYKVQSCSFGYYKSIDNIVHHLNMFFPRLRHLSITESLWLKNRHLKSFPPTLRSIDISHCQKVTNKGLRYLFQRCPNITSHKFAHCYGVSFPGLTGISPQTHTLDVSGWLVALAENPWYTYLPDSLTLLKLSDSDLNDKALAAAKDHWPPKLKKIVIMNCPKVSSSGFETHIPSNIALLRLDDSNQQWDYSGI